MSNNHQINTQETKVISFQSAAISKDQTFQRGKKEFYKQLSLPSTEGLELFSLPEVVYINALSNCTVIQLTGSSKMIVSVSFSEIEKRLKSPLMIKVNPRYLVNINKIKRYVKTKEGGLLIMTNEEHISVHFSYSKLLLNRI